MAKANIKIKMMIKLNELNKGLLSSICLGVTTPRQVEDFSF